MFVVYFGGAFAFSLAVSALFVLLGGREGKYRDLFRRFGGVGIIAAFILGILSADVLIKTPRVVAMLLGTFFILIFGVIDDIKNISWRWQLLFQVFLALTLIAFGCSIQYISGPFGEMIRIDKYILILGDLSLNIISAALITVWVISIINAVNWADGIDGLAGTISLFGCAALVWVSLMEQVNQPAIAIMGLIFAGSVIGFLWFNIPSAKIEAGSSGSYAIGFILASLAIIAGTKIATAMIVLIVPLVDSLWVILERMRNKEQITKRDKRHLHYKLRARGWSDIKIVSVYSVFISLMLFLSILAPTRILKLGTIVLEIVLIIGFIYYVSRSKSNKFLQN
ncbi:MAG: MraY family glycosyltransferase [Patescibacteria group bacterium]|nr:MraY family glycosyltransferase [Patescibacteria group bacterium]